MKTFSFPLARRPRSPAHPFAGVAAGLLAGAVYLAAQLFLAGTDQAPWIALRRICAILLGDDVLSTSSFGVNQAGIGLLIHIGVCVVYGRVVDLVVRGAPTLRATVLGGLVGLAIWAFVFELVAQRLFPWFRGSPDLVTLLDHVVFGAVAGATYSVLRRRWPMPPA